VAVFLLWGAFEAIRGYLNGYALLDDLRGLAAHYYPLFIFVGMGASRSFSTLFVLRYFTFVNILTGLSALASIWAPPDFGNLPWASNVPIIGGPTNASLTLLSAMALAERVTPKFVIGALLAGFAVLVGARSEIIGAVVGVLLILCTRWRTNKRALLFVGATGLLYAGTALMAPYLAPDVGGRAGALTPTRVLARLISMVNKDLAYTIATTSGEDPLYLETEAGTADWRRMFWNRTIDSLDSQGEWMIGHGYGFSLGTLMPENALALRTPHNFGVFLLGYTGITGLFLYSLLALAFTVQVARCPPSRTKIAVVAAGVATIIAALSENYLETPFAAIPTYLTLGMLLQQARDARLRHVQEG
jgi:hypothetical protein